MKRMLTMALILALVVSVIIPFAMAREADKAPFYVWVPAGYESDPGRRYPVVYLLPQGGYGTDDSELEELLIRCMEAGAGMEMLIVKPRLSAGDDLYAVMDAVIAEVDAQYRTVSAPSYRIAMGTGVGGYLAYALLTEKCPFGAVASVRGDFSSDDNPWLPAYGEIAERLQALRRAGILERVYTYMDAPVEDPWTDMPGSTDDMGAQMIEYGIGSESHEFTVRPGVFDETFAAESVGRIMNRVSIRILSDMISGEARPEKAVLTEQDEQAEVICTAAVSGDIQMLTDEAVLIVITVSLTDPDTGEILSRSSEAIDLPGPGAYEQRMTVDTVSCNGSAVAEMWVAWMGFSMKLDAFDLVRTRETVIDGDYQAIDLTGDWHFQYTGPRNALDMASLTKADWEAWPLAQPGFGAWTKGFGNISEDTVDNGFGPDYFDYMITGNGYYARTFTVPEAFTARDLILSVGCVDDRCEVYVNGSRIGATGMDENGRPTGETTWAVFSHFEMDPSILNVGGENIIVVRAWNDTPYGAGGWYAGPIGLYSRAAFDAQSGEQSNERFFEESFPSACAARARNQSGTVENEYLIYLPEGYWDTDRYYPTLYLLHQFNSDHTSYRTDHIDRLLDEGARNGLFDQMIVVIPNSSEESWWTDDWEMMITDELIPHIESKYRAIPDARYRLTAGCSMGGQGAFSVALRNPDFFTGAASFFGAFSYGMGNSPNTIAGKEPAEYLDDYALYFICGNQDSYGFGKPAIELHQRLLSLGVNHGFFIENGGHDSAFYVPFFQDGLSYVRRQMYHSDAALESLLTGKLALADGALSGEVTADPGIAEYLYAPPASSYTNNDTPALRIPVWIEVIRDGGIVAAPVRQEAALRADSLNAMVEYALDDTVPLERNDSVVLKAAVLDRVVSLAELRIED